jgi:LysR family nitrogen assimilation transcriptional regulator
MDLQQIAYFIRVAELGSFSRAASELNLTQPALSRQVSLLEQELKQHLLHRHGRGVEPTEAGRRFLGHGKALLDLAERAKEDLRNLKTTPSGRVVLGLPPRVAHVLTPHLVGTFRRRFPEGSIAIAEGLSAQIREWLVNGRVELALLYDPPAAPQLHYQTLFREEMLLVGVASGRTRLPAHIAIESLRNYPLILPSMPNAIRKLVEHACRSKDIPLNIVAEVDAVHTTLVLASEGHGYAVLPRSAVEMADDKSRLRYACIGKPPVKNTLVLATLKTRQMTRLAEATVQLIQETNWQDLFTRWHDIGPAPDG